jgi:hypothetical protein
MPEHIVVRVGNGYRLQAIEQAIRIVHGIVKVHALIHDRRDVCLGTEGSFIVDAHDSRVTSILWESWLGMQAKNAIRRKTAILVAFTKGNFTRGVPILSTSPQ